MWNTEAKSPCNNAAVNVSRSTKVSVDIQREYIAGNN